MNATLEKIKRSARLISLPDIYFRLRELLAQPDFTMAEVALLVGRDPAMATRFLRIVNSSFYRRVARIETVSHAVSMLGAQQVHDIVLCAAIAESFNGIPKSTMNMRQFWQRSTYCAETARQLSLEWPELGKERMFLIGLLHDIGHLFMYLGIPEKIRHALQVATETERPLYAVERDLLGFDYALVGGLMLKELRLPKGLRLPVACHTEPSRASRFVMETALLHIAANIVQADLEVGMFGSARFRIDPFVWEVLDLTESLCLEAGQTAASQFGAIADNLIY
ncbi:MAG: HDOD domain-containing protein [Desulfosarcinaceae bacterium]|nr:HDOD domain-containing protein [Desulfosarcinaceae bacterium]